MAGFECPVVRVTIETHPNADAIEIARIGDYQSIVKKGQFKDGDLAVYIPEQAVLPEWLLKKMGFWDEVKGKGGLNGALGNRVKAIKLRGVLSQGLVLNGNIDDEPNPQTIVVYIEAGELLGSSAFSEGDDTAEWIGIVKYEPKLPSHMAGKIIGVDFGATHKYDFENLKKTPHLFDDGEPVVITEKIHGTFIQIGIVPTKDANEKYYEGRVLISSKGMGAKGYVLDHNDEFNLYAQAAKKHGLLDGMIRVLGELSDKEGKPVFLCGEVFGKTPSGAGIQDLTYTGEELDFRAFDVCVGNRGNEEYFVWERFLAVCSRMGITPVPLLYKGVYSKDIVLEHTNGKTTLSENCHIREGVVVKSAVEERNRHFGRKIAKSVSEAYLLRKNATEFN